MKSYESYSIGGFIGFLILVFCNLFIESFDWEAILGIGLFWFMFYVIFSSMEDLKSN